MSLRERRQLEKELQMLLQRVTKPTMLVRGAGGIWSRSDANVRERDVEALVDTAHTLGYEEALAHFVTLLEREAGKPGKGSTGVRYYFAYRLIGGVKALSHLPHVKTEGLEQMQEMEEQDEHVSAS